MEGVSSFDTLTSAVGYSANALTETTHFIEGGFIPNLGEFGMSAKLKIFEEIACVEVDHRHCPLGN